MKPLQKIKKRDGRPKEYRGIGTISRFLDSTNNVQEIILIAGNRKTLRDLFYQIYPDYTPFRVGKLRRVKVTKP